MKTKSRSRGTSDLEGIARVYRVPATKGQRVIYSGDKQPRPAVIVGARGAYLKLRFDGDTRTNARRFHPTWEMRYLTDDSTNPTKANP